MGAARSLTDRTATAIDTRFAHFGFHWGAFDRGREALDNRARLIPSWH
jgi:hypothetical protein